MCVSVQIVFNFVADLFAFQLSRCLFCFCCFYFFVFGVTLLHAVDSFVSNYANIKFYFTANAAKLLVFPVNVVYIL